jgi:hypothetical protein
MIGEASKRDEQEFFCFTSLQTFYRIDFWPDLNALLDDRALLLLLVFVFVVVAGALGPI